MITGQKIRIARQLRDVSTKEMAAKLSMDDSSYLRMERGQTKLTEEKVEKVLDALGFTREFVDQIQDIQNYYNSFNDNSQGNFIQNQSILQSNPDEREFLIKSIDSTQHLLEQNAKLLKELLEFLKKS
ncbi:MAG TPA: helix-turn-helix domain-containing protein [Bacteroidia bacterium]|nr:helix-turn-helix domain-containing protein [Bacteroidia bacterium]